MKESIKSIAEWSTSVFPDATLDGQKAKFQDEKAEWQESLHIDDNGLITGDIVELADLYIVACSLTRFDSVEAMFCFATVAGELVNSIYATQDLEKAIDDKMAINRARVWDMKDGQYQHKEG